MKGLVAYGSDDEGSDNGSDQEEVITKSQPKPELTSKTSKPVVASAAAAKRAAFLAGTDLFGKVAPSSKSFPLPSFRPDPQTGKVKIFAPQIDSDEDDEDDAKGPAAKKKALTATSEEKPRSTLFSVLPAPRISSSMIPPSVANRRRAIATEDVEWAVKSRPAAAQQKQQLAASEKSSEKQTSSSTKTQHLKEPAAVETGKNFFALDDEEPLPAVKAHSAAVFDYGTEIGPAKHIQGNIPSAAFGPSRPQPIASASKPVRFDHVENDEDDDDDDNDEQFDDDGDEPTQEGYEAWLAYQRRKESMEGSSSNAPSEQEELRKIAGRYNKGEQINFVECKADDLLDPAEYARQKAIEEARKDLQGPNNMMAPRGRAKSRHQITYLAWLAKEKETEIKEFWAAGKMNKAMSKMKYGF